MAYPLMPISFAENTPQFSVSRSLRFDGTPTGTGSTFLAKKIVYEGNTRTFTQSVWVKRTSLGTTQWIGPHVPTTNFNAGLAFGSDDRLYINVHYNALSTPVRWEGYLATQQLFRDPSAWYHIVVAVDTTQVLPAERIRLFVNGVRVTAFISSSNSSISYPDFNQQTVFNTISPQSVSAISNITNAAPQFHYIGYWTNSYYGGYLSELYWIDGQALAPTAFGRYDQDGNWIPRLYSGTYGPNGFYLPFSNNNSKSYLGMNMGSPAGADPFWSYTTFHLQTRTAATANDNNTFIDSSVTNATITRTGSVAQGTFNPFGSIYPALCSCSAYFNGNGDELNAGSNAGFRFDTGNYTVEFWVYSTTEAYTAGTGPVFLCNDSSGGFIIWNQIGGPDRGIKVQTRTTGTNILLTNTLLPINRWNHIAVCREGTTIALWLNGQRIGLGGDTTNWSVLGPLKIGGISTAGFYLRGWMSDVHVAKGIAKYSTSSTTISIPTLPIERLGSNTTLLCNFRNAAIFDATQNNNIETQGTARVSTAATQYATSSLLLDTNGSALSSTLVNSTPYFSYGVEDFTVEAWINVQQAPAATRNGYIASVHDNLGINTWVVYLTDTLRVAIYGANSNTFISTNAVLLFNWAHIAVVRSGDIVSIYINGEIGGSFNVSGLSYNNGTVGFSMGRREPLNSGGTFEQFFGYISDLRVTRAARYLSPFTPPTASLPTTGRTNNWWPYFFNIGNNRENDSMLDVPSQWGSSLGVLSGSLRGNYCTLHPINRGVNFSLTNGGLDGVSTTADNIWYSSTGTIAVSSGKWYWEVTVNTTPHVLLGIARTEFQATTANLYPGQAGDSWGIYSLTPNRYRSSTATAYGNALANGDVLGMALDLDNGNFFVSINGVWQGASNVSFPFASNPSIGRNPFNSTRLTNGNWLPVGGVYNGTGGSGSFSYNFGQRPFLYANQPELSAGFRPLCTANISVPAIRKPQSFFNAIQYTGGTNTFNTDQYRGNLALAMPLDSYNTYFDVANAGTPTLIQPKGLFTTTGVTYTSISGAQFNGTSSYIELSANSDFNFGDTTSGGDFTIEWWQFLNTLAGNQTVWSNNYVTSPSLLIQTQLNTGRQQIFVSSGTPSVTEGSSPDVSVWNHYAVVRRGTTYTIYRNGVATGSGTSTAQAGNSTARLDIGRGNGSFFVNGNIRDLRAYRGIAKYTTNFNLLTAVTNIVATTGTGSGLQKFVNTTFQPDLVMIKARNIGRTSYIVDDSVRSIRSTLSANSTNAEETSTHTVLLGTNGFAITGTDIQLNTPGATYISWAWKRNINAGMDIVLVNKANAVTETFNHSLGRIPGMMIVKGINTATSWNVYHQFMAADAFSLNNPATFVMFLNSQDAATNSATIWGNTSPTPANFTLGTLWSAGSLIAYLFAEIPGFSRIGNYFGSGAADGPFVWCGFKPRFVLTKRYNAISDWLAFDSARSAYNPINPHLTLSFGFGDQSLTSPNVPVIDFLSNGFKFRVASEPNAVGGRYIYLAFAENPFKYSLGF